MDYQSKIKRIRQFLNLTQESLAHELGVSFATINRWETGKSLPSKLACRVIDEYYRKHHVTD